MAMATKSWFDNMMETREKEISLAHQCELVAMEARLPELKSQGRAILEDDTALPTRPLVPQSEPIVSTIFVQQKTKLEENSNLVLKFKQSIRLTEDRKVRHTDVVNTFTLHDWDVKRVFDDLMAQTDGKEGLANQLQRERKEKRLAKFGAALLARDHWEKHEEKEKAMFSESVGLTDTHEDRARRALEESSLALTKAYLILASLK